MSDLRAYEGRPIRFLDSIAGRITLRSLLLATIPVLVVGLLTIASLFGLARRADNQLVESRSDLAGRTIGVNRAEQSDLVLIRMESFVDERINDVIDWSRATPIIEAAASPRPVLDEVQGLPIGGVEARFGGAYRLDTSGFSSKYLEEQIADQPAYAEVFFTDANGYNVGATNVTSDFVQSDEEWWQRAWSDGAFVGPLEFDESAGVFSFEVAVRIQSAETERNVGVMKAVIDASVLRTYAEEFAVEAEQIDVRIMSADGRLITETASDEDPNRIGAIVSFEGDQGIAFEEAVGTEASTGYLLLDETVIGYSRTPPTRFVERLGIQIQNHDWVVFVEQPSSAALAPLDGLESVGSDLNLSARTFTLMIAGLVVLSLAVAYLVSRLIGNRIAGPINELRLEAHRVADEELPEMVDALRTPGRRAGIPDVYPIEIDADGEVAELADAFNAVRSTAVELAAEQVIGRNRDVAGILLNLGRRNQQLIGRQLQFIDELERAESDPETLHNLFLLDQLATRMRRNAESLLVLAGEESPRRGIEPQPIEQVIRAATGEVEEYSRVEVTTVVPALLRPHLVSDLTHLLAELIENAANFSPPDSLISVIGGPGYNGDYTISIIDEGVGMAPSHMQEANDRLTRPTFAEGSATSFLGLYVVGRLAARHGIFARLVESATSGVTAKVTLPSSGLAPLGDVPADLGPTSTEVPAAAPRPAAVDVPVPVEPSVPAVAAAASREAELSPAAVTGEIHLTPDVLPETESAGGEVPMPPVPTRQPKRLGVDAEPQPEPVEETFGTRTDEVPIPPFRRRESKLPASTSEARSVAPLVEATAVPPSEPEAPAGTRAVRAKNRLEAFTRGRRRALAESAGDPDGGG